MTREPVTVVVTGVGGGGHGHEVVKSLRLAGDRYRLVAVDATPYSFGFGDVETSYVVPRADEPGYLEALADVCAREGARVLVTGSEPELRVVSRNRARFSALGVLPLVNDAAVIDLCMDKARTMSFLSERGFRVPRWVVPADGVEWAETWPCPAVVKPAVGGGGSQLAFIAQDAEELLFFVRYIRKLGGVPLVQEYVGTPEDEYTVGVLTSLDEGALIGSIAVRRYILSGLSGKVKVRALAGPRAGEILALSSGISQGTIEDHPEVRRQCEQLALALGSRGPLNIQLRFVDGRIVPFELNPRFSGTTSFRALAGYNEPDLLIRRHVLGEVAAAPPYRHGRVVRGLVERLLPLAPSPAPGRAATPAGSGGDGRRITDSFEALARAWQVPVATLERYYEELRASDEFLAALNRAIERVPQFEGVRFTDVDQLRAYRCLLYLLTRITSPAVFVETGVLNGFGSAFILLALQHNGKGHLYSIDVPPTAPEIIAQGTPELPPGKSPGWVIPDGLRDRHTLLLGQSEVLLPAWLAEHGPIDVFLHDSDHRYPHVAFELGLAWKYLNAGGWVVCDNVEQSRAFSDFAEGVGVRPVVVASFDAPGRVWKHGLLRKQCAADQ